MSAADYINTEPWDESEEPPIKYVTCKFCGKKGLQWTKKNGQWKLIDIRWKSRKFIREFHSCLKTIERSQPC